MRLYNKYLIPGMLIAVGALDLLIPSVWFVCLYVGVLGLLVSRTPKRIEKQMAFPVNGIIKHIGQNDNQDTEIIVETVPFVHSTVFRFIDTSFQMDGCTEVTYNSGIRITHNPSIYAQMVADPDGKTYGYSFGACTTRIFLPETLLMNQDLVEGMTVIDGETSLMRNG